MVNLPDNLTSTVTLDSKLAVILIETEDDDALRGVSVNLQVKIAENELAESSEMLTVSIYFSNKV